MMHMDFVAASSVKSHGVCKRIYVSILEVHGSVQFYTSPSSPSSRAHAISPRRSAACMRTYIRMHVKVCAFCNPYNVRISVYICIPGIYVRNLPFDPAPAFTPALPTLTYRELPGVTDTVL